MGFVSYFSLLWFVIQANVWKLCDYFYIALQEITLSFSGLCQSHAASKLDHWPHKSPSSSTTPAFRQSSTSTTIRRPPKEPCFSNYIIRKVLKSLKNFLLELAVKQVQSRRWFHQNAAYFWCYRYRQSTEVFERVHLLRRVRLAPHCPQSSRNYDRWPWSWPRGKLLLAPSKPTPVNHGWP